MPLHQFTALFDNLNDRLADTPCHHTLKLSEQFLLQRQWVVQHITNWLEQQGGYCDCEVLTNVEEKFQ